MFKHLLKQIWNQKAVNVWLWLELVVVSVCMAYVTDYLYVMVKVYFSPLGYDIEHVYQVDLASVAPSSKEYKQEADDAAISTKHLFDILARLRTYPGVEAVSVSSGSYPYCRSSSNGLRGIDTTWVHGHLYEVTPEFFRVFRIKDKQGKTEPLVEAAMQENTWILSAECERKFAENNIIAQNSAIKNWKEEEPHHTVRAICSDVRFNDFEPLYPVYYMCYSEAKLLEYDGIGVDICVRVRPEADNPEFGSHFRESMKTQLRLGNIYLLDITSFKDIRDNYFRSRGQFNDIKSHLAALAFLLVNILLGVVGTFWIRTQQRRAEVGVRLALGSSRTAIRRLLIGEGLLLLLLAVVPSLVISLNLGISGLLDTDMMPFTASRFINVEIITVGLISLMIVAGIYLPARQAMKTEPAEALREE